MPLQGTNNFDYWKRLGNTVHNTGLFSLKFVYSFLACQTRIRVLQNSPSESQKMTNPLEHSYQEASAHFVELLYPDQNT